MNNTTSKMRFFVCFLFVASFCLRFSFAAPSLVLTSTTPSSPKSLDPLTAFQDKQKENRDDDKGADQPIIYQFDVNSNISNRFATTLITSKIKNPEKKSKEVVFTVVLPEKAFISEFVMVIGEKSYKAYVREKEEAKNIYNQAVQSGWSAGHVAVSARNSNRFTVSINVEPEIKATFLLTYEEFLERKNNQYELVLNIHPGQIVKHFNVEVLINESRPLKNVRTPSLRSGNEVTKNNDRLDPSSNIQILNGTSAIIKFTPDVESQRKFAKELGGKENEGLAGQFVVQYDVERDPHQGEVLIKDGYFVHFFAPEDLQPLPKHVIFVLDTSGSMHGKKLEQLKDAMNSILDELKESDTFHIVEFNTNVFVWNVATENSTLVNIQHEMEPFEDLLKIELPPAISADKSAIEKGKNVIRRLECTGVTDMLSSIETALHLARLNLKKDNQFRQSMIIFLTDGDPTMGITNPENIANIITRLNSNEIHVPVFSLSFGDGADKHFLRKLSLKNLGLSRHIYQASDASIQLEDFYKEISSPLLSNVEFVYTDVAQVSKKVFPNYFSGSELVVAGKYDPGFDISQWRIKFNAHNGPKSVKSVSEIPPSSLERHWAFLTVKQKLEEREITDNKSLLTKEATNIALKYSFVTDVTSLVVVKPNDTGIVDTEDASKPKQFFKQPGMVYPRLGYMPSGSQGSWGYPGPRLAYRNPIRTPASSYSMSGIGPRTFHAYSIFSTQITLPPKINPTRIVYGQGYAAAGLLPYKCTTNVCTTPFSTDLSSLTTEPTKSDNNTLTQYLSASLRDGLPWLAGIVHKNQTISILGGEYKLGEGESIPPKVECPKTPLNNTEPGRCSILTECRQVHKYLIDFHVYQKYACVVDNQYAGVCCPANTSV